MDASNGDTLLLLLHRFFDQSQYPLKSAYLYNAIFILLRSQVVEYWLEF